MIEVQNRQRRVSIDLPRVRADAARAAALLGIGERPAALVLVSDRSIRALNRDYRGKDEATNVLAFAEDEPEDMPGLPGVVDPEAGLGDVVISLETARREAAEARACPVDALPADALLARVRVLMVHGLLHLLGHDHQDDAQEAAMEAEAARLLARLV